MMRNTQAETTLGEPALKKGGMGVHMKTQPQVDIHLLHMARVDVRFGDPVLPVYTRVFSMDDTPEAGEQQHVPTPCAFGFSVGEASVKLFRFCGVSQEGSCS